MALTGHVRARDDASADAPIASRAVLVLCALSYLAVAYAFAFLDRFFGRFGFEAALWTVWAGIGFGTRILNFSKPQQAKNNSTILLWIAGVLFLFPGFALFALARWLAFGLLLVTAARAGAMQQRRDLYYALASITAVSLLVVIHPTSVWTVWFYLAPAWLLLALTLAWDYASQVRLHAALKASLTAGFLAVCIALAGAFVALVPQPSVMGFGFLEPGTEHPGRVKLPAGQDGSDRQGRSSGGSNHGQGESTAGGGASSTRLGSAIETLRNALKDRNLPGWQRSALTGMLGTAEAIARASGYTQQWVPMRPGTAEEIAEMEARHAAISSFLDRLLTLLLLALLAFVLWLLRWRIATIAAFTGAWALAGFSPALSMRCSTFALRGMLRRAGHPIAPGQSLLEHVDTAAVLPERGRQWLHEALHAYGEWRFGGARASSQRASFMREAIVASDELLRARK